MIFLSLNSKHFLFTAFLSDSKSYFGGFVLFVGQNKQIEDATFGFM